MTFPLPRSNKGPLRRKEWHAFVRAVAAKAGFQLSSDDFISARDTGHGMHLRRKRHAPTVGALQLQIEPRTCGAEYCYVAIDGGVAYGQLDYSETYDNGVINYTSTQPDTAPHIYNAETSHHSCASPDNTNDAEEGFDYGDYISTSATTYSNALAAADLLTEALANLVTSGSPSAVGSWTWTPTGGAVTEVFDTLASLDVDVADIAQDLGYWVDLNPADRIVYSWRYRWISASTMPLQLDWTQGGSAQSLELAAGATSDWYDDIISGTAETPDTITDLTIEEL